MQQLRRLWIPGGSISEILACQKSLLDNSLGSGRHCDASAAGMNGVQVETGRSKGATVVLLHGFGAGLGIFHRNLSEIAGSSAISRLFALDWLGMGGSLRPHCTAAPRLPLLPFSNRSKAVAASVSFFVDGLERWRDAMGVEDFVLVGHSLGGYLAARYAIEHPDRVSSLALVSPAGLPIQPQESERSPSLPAGLRLVDCAWSSNVTPQQILRLLGPRGRRITRDVVSRRFGSSLSESDKDGFAEYLYHVSVAPASGEYAMNSILTPISHQAEGVGVYGREPLLPLLLNASSGDRWPLPISVAFGSSDWLKSPAAERACSQLAAEKGADVLTMRGGHHLYIDDPASFAGMVHDAAIQANMSAFLH